MVLLNHWSLFRERLLFFLCFSNKDLAGLKCVGVEIFGLKSCNSTLLVWRCYTKALHSVTV